MSNQEFRIFDAHFHIIDPGFPLIPNNNFIPDYFTVDDYKQMMSPYLLAGGAVVSGSFQEYDQKFLLSALENLGPDYVGVTQLPLSVSDREIIELKQSGIKGLRLNIKRGGSEKLKYLKNIASRVYELAGWHVELYLDSKMLSELHSILLALPRISIDHLGMDSVGFDSLLDLVEHGAFVKASGFGRLDFDIPSALKKIHAINPAAIMFGTDLPSTRASRPYCHDDFLMIINSLGDEAARQVFYQNAINFYNISGNSD